MDTPSGLLVPNIKNVQARSMLDIAAELSRLSTAAHAGKLTPADLSGGTITVSNIGTIGGTYVAPVIVPTEVAILGVGKARTVPVFDDGGKVVPGQKMAFSWSADHRVVDGATMARMAEKVRGYLETPERMMLTLR
jgi:2-oxoisovalerate dehydrogenase E2 component (dihydrolipoyl transacylase)